MIAGGSAKTGLVIPATSVTAAVSDAPLVRRRVRAGLVATLLLSILAAPPAEAGVSAPRVLAAAAPLACQQNWWTGTWKRQEHAGDAIFVQQGASISSGRYTWSGGGAFSGMSLGADCMSMRGTSPKTSTLPTAVFLIELARPGVFTGHWRWATTQPPRWDGTFGGRCTAGACLERRPVPIAAVSNGCGGAGWDSVVAAQNYLGNASTYRNSNLNPTARAFTVDFKDACDLHDACYGGELVLDAVRGGTRDFRAWARRDCDFKFRVDMRLLCERRIPPAWTVALANCKSTGGNASFGADSRFNFVRTWGHLFFDADLDLPGSQKTGPRSNA